MTGGVNSISYLGVKEFSVGNNPGLIFLGQLYTVRIVSPKILKASSSRNPEQQLGVGAHYCWKWSLRLPYLVLRHWEHWLSSSCSAASCHHWQLLYRISLHTHERMWTSCFPGLQHSSSKDDPRGDSSERGMFTYFLAPPKSTGMLLWHKHGHLTKACWPADKFIFCTPRQFQKVFLEKVGEGISWEGISWHLLSLCYVPGPGQTLCGVE